MAKKIKKQAKKAGSSQLAKLKEQILNNYKESKDKKVHLITLTSKHYKKKLSMSIGFGAQDLKPVYFELYTFMLQKFGQNLLVELLDMSEKKVGFYIKK